jgi:hypothetical protein
MGGRWGGFLGDRSGRGRGRKEKAESREQKAVNCLGDEGREREGNRKQETGNR